ncbi:MAG: hypothetical protein JSU75_08445 [Gammaproteobacteria bacterium]|nr:MAG: hypothetical protein JSU75_08445 [Gammaproteobacteria bacterium]
MKICTEKSRFSISMTHVLLAGLAGGLAEVLWVLAWSAVTPLQAATVAREVTHTLFPALAETPVAAEIGLIIHLAISLAIGLVFMRVLGKRLAHHYGGAGILAGSVALLTLIWTVNFLVVLPALNPVFVTLMPSAVTLGSKTLFGIAMAAVLVARPHTLTTAQKSQASV